MRKLRFLMVLFALTTAAVGCVDSNPTAPEGGGGGGGWVGGGLLGSGD